MSENDDYGQRVLRKLADLAKEDLPKDWCFMLVVYQPRGDGDMHFAANGSKENATIALRTLADQIESEPKASVQ